MLLQSHPSVIWCHKKNDGTTIPRKPWGAFLVQPQRRSGLTVCCVIATRWLSVGSAGKRATRSHRQPCRQLNPDKEQQQRRQQQQCKDGLENYVPRLSSSTCSREFSMHCWRVSSGPWRRRRPNCPSEPTIWRGSAKPDSGHGESNGNSDKRMKLPPATGWGIAAVKVVWIINTVRTPVNNAGPTCHACERGDFSQRKLRRGGYPRPHLLSSPTPSASAPSAASHGGAHAAAALSCCVRVLNDIVARVNACVCVCYRVVLFVSEWWCWWRGWVSERGSGFWCGRVMVSCVTFTLSAHATQWCQKHLQAAVCSLTVETSDVTNELYLKCQ